MKNLLFILLALLAIKASAQNLSGIYSGTIKNDSLKMVQDYELALSEYKGKITGYSYITFVKNDTFYYGIKRIKATRDNGQLIVEDVEMLMNNYPQRPDKGVHLINTFPLIGDSIVNLNGTWKTTESKKHRFYSIGGNLSLRRDEDSTRSPLINHLKELNIIRYQQDKNLVAKKESKQKPEENNAPVNAGTATASIKETRRNDREKNKPSDKPSETANSTISEQSKTSIVSAEHKDGSNHNFSKGVKDNQALTTASANTDVKLQTKPEKTAVASSKEKSTSQQITKEAVAVDTKPAEQKQAATEATAVKQEIKTEIATAPSPLEKRATNTMQTVTVASDSLVLSFYDNGIVDGDSISVYLNNENIISKVKLTEAAAKKTIYVPKNADEIKVTLVAESLGSIPPNTGLLVIQDGSDRYNIRFSADMQTNASVIIKKKK